MTDLTSDQIVADYLARLETALAGAAPDRRRELLEEIASHLADARAELPDGGDEAAVRTLLDRLGEPGEIAAAAFEDQPAPPAAAPAAEPPTPSWKEGLAIALLLVGGIVLPVVGWFAGVALLWTSKVWETRDKLYGTLVIPFGLSAAAALALNGLDASSGESCTEVGGSTGETVRECVSNGSTTSVGAAILLVLLIAVPLATSIHLGLRLRDSKRARSGRALGAAETA